MNFGGAFRELFLGSEAPLFFMLSRAGLGEILGTFLDILKRYRMVGGTGGGGYRWRETPVLRCVNFCHRILEMQFKINDLN